jgi:hypothetical protein
MFFSLIGLVIALIAIALGIPVVLAFLDTGEVRRFPTAILCSGLGVIAVVCIATGLVLDLVAHVRREAKRLVYLQHPAPRAIPRAEPRRAPLAQRAAE